MKKLLVFFAAGCVGGLVNSLIVWQFGQLGINSTLGVAIAPTLTPHWLYPRIVWGGIWGLLFILPMLRSKLFLKGIVLSLFPTLVQLFIIFPLKTHHGVAGLNLGTFTPVLVIFFNAAWGFASAFTLKIAR